MPPIVVLDADVVRDIFGIVRDRVTEEYDVVDVFKKIFDSLGKKPVIHEYVYNNELIVLGPSVKDTLQKLVKSDYIKVVKFSDHIEDYNNPSSNNRSFYCLQCQKIRQHCSMSKIPTGLDIFQNAEGWSLGEIHSYLMAVSMGYEYLYSNDRDVKNFNYVFPENKHITVKNIDQVIKEMSSSGFKLNRSIINAILSRKSKLQY